jgi:hypothetical protein
MQRSGKIFSREVKLKEIQSIIEEIKSDIQEGKPEEEIIHALLPILNNEPETACQVLEDLANIPHPSIARILQRLFDILGDKKIRKVIKRSLYRLKGKGIPIEEVTLERGGPVFRPFQADPPRGWGGGYDFLGQRFLVLAVPHKGSGWTVIQGIISDTQGLVDFSCGEMNRRGFKTFFEEVQKGSPFPLVEIEPSYVGFLFNEAYQLTIQKGKTPPQDYLRMKGEIERIKKDEEKALIYSHIEESKIEGDERMLQRGGDLLKMDFYSGWRIDEEEIRPYADEVWEAEESKLILNPTQKEVRFQEIYQRALSSLFPEERRLLYRRRMEEMAYVLFKLGREEEARISLTVALDLKKPARLIQPNPFLFQLVIKSIFALLKEAYDKKVKEPSFIMKP